LFCYISQLYFVIVYFFCCTFVRHHRHAFRARLAFYFTLLYIYLFKGEDMITKVNKYKPT